MDNRWKAYPFTRLEVEMLAVNAALAGFFAALFVVAAVAMFSFPLARAVLAVPAALALIGAIFPCASAVLMWRRIKRETIF